MPTEDDDVVMVDSDWGEHERANDSQRELSSSDTDDDDDNIDYTWIKRGMTVLIQYEAENGLQREGLVYVRKVDHHTGEMVVTWFYYPKDIPGLRELLTRHSYELTSGRVEEVFFSAHDQKMHVQTVLRECPVWCLENSVLPDYAHIAGPKGGPQTHVCWLIHQSTTKDFKKDKLFSLKDGGFLHEDDVHSLLIRTRNRLISRGFDLIPITENDFKQWARAGPHVVRFARRLKEDALVPPLKPTLPPRALAKRSGHKNPREEVVKAKGKEKMKFTSQASDPATIHPSVPAAQTGPDTEQTQSLTWAEFAKKRIAELESQIAASEAEPTIAPSTSEAPAETSEDILQTIAYAENVVRAAGKVLMLARPDAFLTRRA